jgi:hypothetical protein
VDGDDIVFEGRSVSPAQMANTVAGGTRNAWRELWILSPGETVWKSAWALRNQARQIDSALATPQPAPLAAAPVATAAGPAEALLRRLALLLERNLDSRQPQYRRRTDTMDAD